MPPPDSNRFLRVREVALSPKELSRRWRCRVATIRQMIRRGTLPAIVIGGRIKITPEAVADAEHGLLAVKPRKARREKGIDAEVQAMLR